MKCTIEYDFLNTAEEFKQTIENYWNSTINPDALLTHSEVNANGKKYSGLVLLTGKSVILSNFIDSKAHIKYSIDKPDMQKGIKDLLGFLATLKKIKGKLQITVDNELITASTVTSASTYFKKYIQKDKKDANKN